MSDATFAHLHLLLIRFFIDCISAENIENSLANVFLLPSSFVRSFVRSADFVRARLCQYPLVILHDDRLLVSLTRRVYR